MGLEKELTPKEIETIMKFADKEDKGYLSLEDVIRCINGNKIVDVWLVFVFILQQVYKIQRDSINI